MYISRIPLNTARYEGRRLVGSPYRLHAAVEKSFAPGAVRTDDTGRILWRLDTADDGKELWLYVVSPEQPDFSHIIEQAGWVNGGEQQTKDYERLLSRISLGQQWQFRLRANTVRSAVVDRGGEIHKDPAIQKARDEGRRGHLKGDATAEWQLKWLEKRSERNGFRILASPDDLSASSCLVSQRFTEHFRKHGDPHPVTLTTCQFDGLLEVTDADLFEHVLRFGIGRGRGFGCGLMTVAPLR